MINYTSWPIILPIWQIWKLSHQQPQRSCIHKDERTNRRVNERTHLIYISLITTNEIQNLKSHTVGTVPISNQLIVDTKANSIPLAHTTKVNEQFSVNKVWWQQHDTLYHCIFMIKSHHSTKLYPTKCRIIRRKPSPRKSLTNLITPSFNIYTSAQPIDWLINWCLTPILAVFQLYRGVMHDRESNLLTLVMI